MLFNSYAFFIFLPIVFFLYWFVVNKSLDLQNGLILLASYVFYSWWDWRFLSLLFLSTGIDYYFGFLVATTDNKKKRWYLWLSIFNNLLVLGIFKYYNFFALEFQQFFHAIGVTINPILIGIALPVGISFYTFHGMSYVLDIYKGKVQPEKSFIRYATFVSFFPLLVAGPIERAAHLLPQINHKRAFNYTQAIEGLRLILWGLVKKVVIADSLAEVVSPLFSNPEAYPGSTLLVGAVLFSFQIYGDFSGYTDIAIGTAKLFGFELLTNFRFPYFSRDIAEFWRRWHISLSSWFRDYVYIPLGGSRGGKWLSIRNVLIIFLLSGFWHGASWNFIIWGGLHAVAFIPLLLRDKNRTHVDVVAMHKVWPGAKELIQMLFTFALVTFAWIFFRSASLPQTFNYIQHIPKGLFSKPTNLSFLFLYIIPFVLVEWHLRRDERVLLLGKNNVLRYLIYILLVFLLLYHSGNNAEFIYFQF
ncbi:MAG: MBOAT family protein [Sphingobacteriales bacterium]|nr:MBOAT family protein [Sphingobacteriales bacterium]